MRSGGVFASAFALVLALALALSSAPRVSAAVTVGSNELINPSFEVNGGTVGSSASLWTHFQLATSYGVDSAFARTGSWSARVIGSGTSTVLACKQIVSYTANTTATNMRGIRFGGWARAASVSSDLASGYSVWLDITYSDGTVEFGVTTPFNQGSHGFEQSTRDYCPRKRVSQIAAHGLLRGAGTSHFDDLSVARFTSQDTQAAQSSVSAVSGTTVQAGRALIVGITGRDSANAQVPCGGDDFTVTATTAPQAVSSTLTDNADGTYTLSQNFTVVGTYTFDAKLSGVSIGSSPITFTVVPGAVNATRTLLISPLLNTTAGMNTTLVLQPRDQFGNNITDGSAAIVATLSPSVAGASLTTTLSGGRLHISLSATTAGTYTVAVTAAGVALPGSPFTVIVSPSVPNLASFSAAGAVAAMETYDTNTITVEARDIFGNALTTGTSVPSFGVALVASGTDLATSVSDNGAGVWTITVTPSNTGTKTLTITANGTNVQGSPFSIASAITRFGSGQSTVTGNHTAELSPGAVAFVEATLRDASGAVFPPPAASAVLLYATSGPGNITVLSVTTVPLTGRVRVTFTATALGSYIVAFTISGQPAPSSPYTVQVVIAPPRINAFVASDPGQRFIGYSNEDTLSIVFDTTTNRPSVADRVSVDSLFTFSEPLGVNYRGQWTDGDRSNDVCVITVTDVTGGSPILLQSTVRVTGNLRNAAGTSAVSRSISPVLSGDFGLQGCWPYGVWFNNLCWWAWVVIFAVIGVVVLGCIVFWCCWWRNFRDHLDQMDEYERKESKARVNDFYSRRSIRRFQSRYADEVEPYDDASAAVDGDVEDPVQRVTSSAQIIPPQRAQSGARKPDDGAGLSVPQDNETRSRSSIVNIFRDLLSGKPRGYHDTHDRDKESAPVAAINDDYAGASSVPWRKRSNVQQANATSMLMSAPPVPSGPAGAGMPSPSAADSSLRTAAGTDVRKTSTRFEVANIHATNKPAPSNAANASTLLPANLAPGAGGGRARAPSFLNNDSLAYNPDGDRRGSSVMSRNSYEVEMRNNVDDMFVDESFSAPGPSSAMPPLGPAPVSGRSIDGKVSARSARAQQRVIPLPPSPAPPSPPKMAASPAVPHRDRDADTSLSPIPDISIQLS